MSKGCYIVLHQNYAEGGDAYAFYSKEQAKKELEADVRLTVQNLEQDGYSPVWLTDACDGHEVYVPDTDIYYEWSIIPSTIE